MGCNSTKQQDVKNSRERVPQQQTPQKSQNANFQNQAHNAAPVSTGKKVNEGPENVAESYSDLRNKEKEMFQSILNRTAMKLIDVGMSPGVMENEIDQHLQPEEQEEQEPVNVMTVDHPDIFGLPLASDVSAREQVQIRDVFCEGNLTQQDAQMAKDALTEITQALATLSVNDSGIEPLVVQLPEIEL